MCVLRIESEVKDCMKQQKLSRLQELLWEMTETSFVSGVNCMVMQGGQEQCYYEAGMRDLAAGLPMTRDTIFRLYSMTKPVTAAAAMILLEEGRIDLYDPVSDYLPGFCDQEVMADGVLIPAKRPVIIQDLLNMTSGLTYPGEGCPSEIRTDQLMDEVITNLSSSHALTTCEIMNRLGKIPLAFQPGEKWHYGMSADVLGAVIEVVSGMRFGDFLRQRIFEPLHMNDTGFFVPPEKQARLSKAYQDIGKGLEEFHFPRLGISNDMKTPPAFESGGAGLVSTIDDYARFAQMLLQRGSLGNVTLLSSRTVDFMANAHLAPALDAYVWQWESLSGCTYANLMRIMRDPGAAISISRQGEFGWDGWMGTYMTIDPADDMILLLMLQKTDTGTTAYTRKIRNIVFSALD